MPNHALILEYDGLKFYGLQKQLNLVTVQGALEKALSTILRGENTRIIAAGRTDTGVHAKGMVLNFHTLTPIHNYHKFMVSLNALAGGGLSVLAAKEMPDDFHARFSCTEREYEYRIINSKFPHPLLEGRAFWFKEKLDLDFIQSEAANIIGKHDFTSLAKKAAIQKGRSPERHITSIQVDRLDDEIRGLFRIKIRGTGFLHNMVRITIGTILDISCGKLKSVSIRDILSQKDRTRAGYTLPPHGLYFIKAYYRNFPEIEDLYKFELNEYHRKK